MKSKSFILLIIVIAQFLCTSLWFAGNAIVDELITVLDFPQSSIGHLTSSIQFGFILGTLLYAILSIADRISPSKVFFTSAILGAISNGIFLLPEMTFAAGLTSRFLTGFFLAGIYPVGMKIAADHFDKTLGKSLGYLVGALVIGTAFPHLIKDFLTGYSYKYVVIGTSLLAILGGSFILLLVPDGPFRKASQKIQFKQTFAAFRFPAFRSAAFGYFGHMWELYTFYAFVPLMVKYFNEHSESNLNVSFWSFIVIAIGGVGCFVSGYLSGRLKPKHLASIALLISGLMCLISPLILGIPNQWLFILMLLIWGFTVVADSPMFSTLVAQNAIPELKGTALTIVNSIGFALTIISIQLVSFLDANWLFPYIFMVLSIGPLFGLISLWNKNT